MDRRDKFAALIGPVATELLGEPNKRLTRGNCLRFGSHGALEVDTAKGTWVDFARDEGAPDRGGGTIDLIIREANTDRRGAVAWLEERGLIEPAANPNGAAKKSKPNGKDHSAPARKTAERLVKSYPYVDENGEILFEVLRYEWEEDGKRKKRFTQRRPSPEGGWIWGVAAGTYRKSGSGDWYPCKDGEIGVHFDAVRQVPYRLPELLDALKAGTPVFVVEGEKDVDNLYDLDFAATCNAMGAGKWPDSFASFFEGADIVILRDNDQAGWKHALAVASNCKGAARSMKQVDLPDLPDKGDVSDWIDGLRKARTPDEEIADQLARFAADAPPWKPERPVTSLPALAFEDLDKPGPEHEWLVKGLLPKAERALVYGPPEAAKSFWMLSLCMAVAEGKPFFGKRTERGLVVYQAGEGELGLKKRMRAYRRAHNIPPDAQIPFVVMPKKIDLFSSDDDTNALIEFCKAWSAYFDLPVALVVIDTLSKAMPGGNENSSEDVTAVLSRQDRIAKELSACVPIIHHTNADGGKPRGHTALMGDIESLIHIEKDLNGKKDETGEAVRYVTVRKQKDGRSGEKGEFVLKEIHLGEDRYGDAITSCVPVPPTYAGRGFNQPRVFEIRGEREKLAFKTMLDLMREEGTAAPAGVKAPDYRVVIDQKSLREAVSRVANGESDEDRRENARKGLERAIPKWQSAGIIGADQGFIWLTGMRVAEFVRAIEEVAAIRPDANRTIEEEA